MIEGNGHCIRTATVTGWRVGDRRESGDMGGRGNVGEEMGA